MLHVQPRSFFYPRAAFNPFQVHRLVDLGLSHPIDAGLVVTAEAQATPSSRNASLRSLARVTYSACGLTFDRNSQRITLWLRCSLDALLLWVPAAAVLGTPHLPVHETEYSLCHHRVAHSRLRLLALLV